MARNDQPTLHLAATARKVNALRQSTRREQSGTPHQPMGLRFLMQCEANDYNICVRYLRGFVLVSRAPDQKRLINAESSPLPVALMPETRHL